MAVEFNRQKLKGKIIEIFGSQSNFAKARNQSERTISLKINSKVPFTDEEILSWCEDLSINSSEIDLYFFTPKVQ